MKPKAGLYRLAIQAMAGGIVALFFVPWVVVHVDMVKPVGKITRELDKATGTGLFSGVVSAVQDSAGGVIGTQNQVTLSGFQIANSGRSRVALLLSDVLSVVGQTQKDPRRIKFLFLVPVLAVGLAWLLTGPVSGQKIIRTAAAWISIAAASFAAYKLIHVSVDTEFAKIQLTYGIWATCLLLFLMGVPEVFRKK